MNDDAINEMLHSLAHCETFAGSRRVVKNFLDTHEQAIIAAFLERTGQYVTNDASREAAVAAALASRHEAPVTPSADVSLIGAHDAHPAPLRMPRGSDAAR